MRDTPSRKSAQDRTIVPPAPAVQAAIVSTRNEPPGNSGKLPGAGKGGLVRGVMPLTAATGAEKLPPPSVDLTNMMFEPAIQTT